MEMFANEDHDKVAKAHWALATFYGVSIGLFAVFGIVKARMGIFMDLIPLTAIPLLLHFFVGRGARQKKAWARVASFILGALMLFVFPLGTAVGIYMLIKTWPSWN